MNGPDFGPDGASQRQRLFVYSAGFLRNRQIRRMLDLAGYDIRLGLPGKQDAVGIWGNSPTALRGRAVAARRNSPLLRVEDAFLRSLHPGRAGEPPAGLTLDRSGVHFNPTAPSDLEQILASAPLDDTALLNRARDAMSRLRASHLSKYSDCDPTLPAPPPGYVLVVDQTLGDASVRASNGNRALFREMLVFAQEEHPGVRVIIKTHPETATGHRPGYFTEADATNRVSLLSEPISPWVLLNGAVGVYTVSSQLGFEAIFAGHKPRVFGQPFYAGWRLTQDESPVPRRERHLSRAQLFAAAMMLYPIWYDPFRDRLCQLETVLDRLETQTAAWRQDRHGWIASRVSLWKRRRIQQMFGQHNSVVFDDAPPPDTSKKQMIWASKTDATAAVTRIEDGFLRSRGLGAELVAPMSLVLDDLGIYYDPSHPSELENLIARRVTLTAEQRSRAERLIAQITRMGLSKYNPQGDALPSLPTGHRILVVGQVEDDASVLTGAGSIYTNTALLETARTARPEAVLVYKPHPDVESGLRKGAVDLALADVVMPRADPAGLLDQVDEVWTITSLLGFEALLRGRSVTTLGAPFYAGWGMTTDLGSTPARRTARPDLAGLVHATLIDYPRYFDPITGQICPVEVVAERLAEDQISQGGPGNRILSKLQGLFASQAHHWRR